MKIRMAHEDDFAQWVTLWKGYQVFYKPTSRKQRRTQPGHAFWILQNPCIAQSQRLTAN